MSLKLTALELCVQHWARLNEYVYGLDEPVEEIEREGYTASECALCGLYYKRDRYPCKSCFECPIYEKTGEKFCEATPYDKAVDQLAYAEAGEPWETEVSNGKEAPVIEMLKFLKELRDEVYADEND